MSVMNFLAIAKREQLLGVVTSILAISIIILCMDNMAYTVYHYDEHRIAGVFFIDRSSQPAKYGKSSPLHSFAVWCRDKRIFETIQETCRLFLKISCALSDRRIERVRKVSFRIFTFGCRIFFCLIILVCSLIFGRVLKALNNVFAPSRRRNLLN